MAKEPHQMSIGTFKVSYSFTKNGPFLRTSAVIINADTADEAKKKALDELTKARVDHVRIISASPY